jgi:hypothetical protein
MWVITSHSHQFLNKQSDLFQSEFVAYCTVSNSFLLVRVCAENFFFAFFSSIMGEGFSTRGML